MSVPISQALVKVIADRSASHNSGVAILDPLTGAVQARGRRHGLPLAAPPVLDPVVREHAGPPDDRADQRCVHWIGVGHASVSSTSSGGYVNYLEPRRHVASYYGAEPGPPAAGQAHLRPGQLLHHAILHPQLTAVLHNPARRAGSGEG